MYDFATALCRHVYARYLSKLISAVVVVAVVALRKHCNTGPALPLLWSFLIQAVNNKQSIMSLLFCVNSIRTHTHKRKNSVLLGVTCVTFEFILNERLPVLTI